METKQPQELISFLEQDDELNWVVCSQCIQKVVDSVNKFYSIKENIGKDLHLGNVHNHDLD